MFMLSKVYFPSPCCRAQLVLANMFKFVQSLQNFPQIFITIIYNKQYDDNTVIALYNIVQNYKNG